jgi:CRISPR-associated protein Cmr4
MTIDKFSAIFGLYAETSIHAGAGESLGVIDLPIMRENTTGWPCIFGSAVKGAMRAKATEAQLSLIDEIFGPETTNAAEHAGAIASSDARLLLLPMRSLSGHFKWATCPAVLEAALNCAKRFGYENFPDIPEPESHQALLNHSNDEPVVYLEQYQFITEKKDLTQLILWLSNFMPNPNKAKSKLEKQLIIIDNDIFSDMAKSKTPVNQHNAIEYSTKTTKPGALWTEETLPPDTVLYLPIYVNQSRKAGSETNSEAMFKSITENILNNYLQVGANETVGMGWFQVVQLNRSSI